MAMRKDQIPDNKFTLPLDARELALYTRQITKNAKVFDLGIDASLPGQQSKLESPIPSPAQRLRMAFGIGYTSALSTTMLFIQQ